MPQKAQHTRKRTALIIGNSYYAHIDALSNSVNDARAVSDLLKETGFDVLLRLDLDREKMEEAVSEFMGKRTEGDVALF